MNFIFLKKYEVLILVASTGAAVANINISIIHRVLSIDK